MARKSCLMYFVVGCACFSWQRDFTFDQDENLLLDQDKNRLQGAQEWSAQRNLQVTPLTRQKVWSNYSDSDKQAKRKDLDVSSWLKDDKKWIISLPFFSSTLIWICPCLTHQLNLTPFPRLFNYFGLWIGICFIIWVSRLRCCELHAGGLTFNEIIIGIIEIESNSLARARTERAGWMNSKREKSFMEISE